MSKYLVKSRLKHCGEEYKEGSIIELPENTAKILVANGTIVDATPRDLEKSETPSNKKKGANA